MEYIPLFHHLYYVEVTSLSFTIIKSKTVKKDYSLLTHDIKDKVQGRNCCILVCFIANSLKFPDLSVFNVKGGGKNPIIVKV
jgi:hypothetical protein